MPPGKKKRKRRRTNNHKSHNKGYANVYPAIRNNVAASMVLEAIQVQYIRETKFY